MGTLQLHSSHSLASFSSNLSPKFTYTKTQNAFKFPTKKHQLGLCRGKIRAIGTASENQAEPTEPEEEEGPPSVDFAFIASVLLPDGTPDLHLRRGVGGQNLRKFMMETNIELYGPYSRPLLNCAGGGTCGTCMVEVVDGKELLNRRTDIEKEKLKKKPKNWRLACQTTVGNPESRGMLVIQQLPEWKAHEWAIEKNPEFDDQS
uniref:Photosynthetic NDH subcomplex B 3 n=1 Tax=Geranium maderense TaxID=28964 RepID=A0A0F7GZ29_9ROSI